MQTEQPWYIGLRSEALAMVYLTRRDDLIVSPSQKNTAGLDFLVTITKDSMYSGRLFGVEVKAKISSDSLTQNGEVFKLKNSHNHQTLLRDLPFPVCLFFFTLDNDQGYYQWILEPIIKSENNAGLQLRDNNELKKLDNQAIDNIISLVNSWYDQRNQLT
ncbi:MULTISPECIES: DUF4365 domain-containing protein [unclassified Anabaena]|uniref:DUF4365 domain-containing protein n=1 Tax=unclassified Anabaena TaxID=2619674 RepID=UPI002B21E381|nr:DUF4365 domain-containing protein [Anabaena sp. UHCC 0399]MEA5567092.1 DUF4365 domain-containing protein [Anabaena sp. UHCC 0399]